MKTLFPLLIFILVGTSVHAQSSSYDQIKRSGVYLEAYILRHDFSDGFFSINYEVALGRRRMVNARLGVYPDFSTTVSFPMTVSWITQPLNKHHFEGGFGAVLRVEHYNDNWYYDMPALMVPLMYRYQKERGLYFRGGVNLFLSWPILPSPSLSVGWRF